MPAGVAGCFDHPSAGNNQGRTRRGSRGIEYQSFRHNSLYAVAGWHVDSDQPLFLMIFRVENRPTGQEPHASHGYKDDTGQPGFEVKDFSQQTTWAQYVYEESAESARVFGEDYMLDNGRIFVADTTATSPGAVQLNMQIPFTIPARVVCKNLQISAKGCRDRATSGQAPRRYAVLRVCLIARPTRH